MRISLDMGINRVKNVGKFTFGGGSARTLSERLLNEVGDDYNVSTVYFIDHYFKSDENLLRDLGIIEAKMVFFVDTSYEPTTSLVDEYITKLRSANSEKIQMVVAVGGGCTLDVGKAVANLLTNEGVAADYQGWDLVKNPAVYKIGIPTISGTGAEASRTCVMTNKSNGLKLGMNSDYTIYDELILDPDLTKTVSRNQYFYTGMDSYIHCIESLNGAYRNPVADALSDKTLQLCRDVFFSSNMMSDDCREKMMVASYLGGASIGMSYVGLVHPLSAGLSVVMGTHHCVANCIVMRAMKDFYPKEYDEFWEMVERQKVDVPIGIALELNDTDYSNLYKATIIHEKPLFNALGENFKDILTFQKVKELFQSM